MSKYVSIFFLTLMLSFIFFIIFDSIFSGGGDPAEEAVFTLGSIIVLLLAFLISQVYYLIDLLKRRSK